MATHQQSTSGPPGVPTSTTTADGTPTVQAEELLELLGDEYTRRVLRAVTDQPRTGREIATTADVSKPTAYRRLERLEDAGLVATTQRIDPDGHHCKQFHAVVAGIDLEFGEGGVDVSVETDDAATGGSGRAFVADD